VINCWDGGQVVVGEGVWSKGVGGSEGEGGVVQGVRSLDWPWGCVGVRAWVVVWGLGYFGLGWLMSLVWFWWFQSVCNVLGGA